MHNVKLGKLEPKRDDRTLRLANYIDPEKALAALPTGDLDLTKPRYPMYGNDRVGDCGLAGQAHLIGGWTWAANGGQEVLFTDQQVLDAYSQVSGWNGRLNDPSDTGVYLLDALNWWRKAGIGGHRITAYAKVEVKDDVEMRAAAYLFGGLYFGFALPEFVQGLRRWYMADRRKGDDTPGSWGGHCVTACRWSPRTKKVASWGSQIAITKEFVHAYCDECYAVLSPDWLSGDRSPQGFDLQALLNDLHTITTT